MSGEIASISLLRRMRRHEKFSRWFGLSRRSLLDVRQVVRGGPLTDRDPDSHEPILRFATRSRRSLTATDTTRHCVEVSDANDGPPQCALKEQLLTIVFD